MSIQQNTSEVEPRIYCAGIAASNADSQLVSECNAVQIVLTKKQMRNLIQRFEQLQQEHGSNLNVVEVTAVKSNGPGPFDLHELAIGYGTKQGFPYSNDDIDE